MTCLCTCCLNSLAQRYSTSFRKIHLMLTVVPEIDPTESLGEYVGVLLSRSYVLYRNLANFEKFTNKVETYIDMLTSGGAQRILDQCLYPLIVFRDFYTSCPTRLGRNERQNISFFDTVPSCYILPRSIMKLHAVSYWHGLRLCFIKSRLYWSRGTPPTLTFQARLLHNEEGDNAEKGGFQKILSRAFFTCISCCSNPIVNSTKRGDVQFTL